MRRKRWQVPWKCARLLQKGLSTGFYKSEWYWAKYGWGSKKVKLNGGILYHLELSSTNKGYKSFPFSLNHINSQMYSLIKLQGLFAHLEKWDNKEPQLKRLSSLFHSDLSSWFITKISFYQTNYIATKLRTHS